MKRIGARAMSNAERQARYRRGKAAKAAEARRVAELRRRIYQPPKGYAAAKEILISAGHTFERARREFGFEEGAFVDGAYLGSLKVIELAKLPDAECTRRLAVERQSGKDFAFHAVTGYMAALRVTPEELIRHLSASSASAA